jgi:hypothetical protein
MLEIGAQLSTHLERFKILHRIVNQNGVALEADRAKIKRGISRTFSYRKARSLSGSSSSASSNGHVAEPASDDEGTKEKCRHKFM